MVAPVCVTAALISPGEPPLVTCGVLEATGLPCPACGATRAFIHLAHGDLGFTHFNWVWPLFWLIALAGTLLVAVRRWRGRPAFGPWLRRFGHELRHRPALVVALPFLLAAPAWAVALANLEWIR